VLNALEQGAKAADTIMDYLDGSGRALGDFADSLEDKFTNYLRDLHPRYQQEGRWLDSPFWKKRANEIGAPSIASENR
jgi:hypothetical protein